MTVETSEKMAFKCNGDVAAWRVRSTFGLDVVRRRVATMGCAVLIAVSSFAQSGGSTPPGQSAPAPQSDRQKAAEQLKQQEKQRILGIVPQFNVSNIPDAVRLSARQKFELAFKTETDPMTILSIGIIAGVTQAQDGFPGYGQGMEGYGKRLGASYLDSFDGAMIGNAILPVVLHQDPRYFRKGTGSFGSRLGYAVLSTFRAKSDSGNWQPNYSNVLGNFAAGGISNLYYPAGERGLVSTYQRAIEVTAEGAVGAIASEFWPDISRHFRKHRHDSVSAPSGNAENKQ